MRSAGVRRASLARMMAAALLCCASLSCGGADDITGGDSSNDPPGTLSDLFGAVLYKADGSSVGLQAVQTKAIIGIYFASRSCPACGAFTPQLVSTYNELKKADKSFEIVFACVDASSADLFAYMQQYGMGWVAIPLGSDKIMALIQRYDVEWVPTLIVIDEKLRTITKTGREDVASKGPAAFDAWLAASQGP